MMAVKSACWLRLHLPKFDFQAPVPESSLQRPQARLTKNRNGLRTVSRINSFVSKYQQRTPMHQILLDDSFEIAHCTLSEGITRISLNTNCDFIDTRNRQVDPRALRNKAWESNT